MLKRYCFVWLLYCVSQSVFAIDLNDHIKRIEKRILGRVGVSVITTHNEKIWSYRGDERFPLMSTFKSLLCAKLLFDADKNHSSELASVAVSEKDLVVWSPVTKKLVGQSISINDACEATMLTSDNTAANIVLKYLGGPAEVTEFIHSLGDNKTQLNRYEPDLNEAKTGDLRDSTTPNNMVKNLRSLLLGDTLTANSSTQLKSWMQQNSVSDALLRSVLPEGWSIADRSGAGGNGSRGITAMIWNDNMPPLFVAIYITETKLPFEERNSVIAEIGQLIFNEYENATLN